MKKLLGILAGAILSLGISGVVSAATCSITGPTGPNSNNTCSIDSNTNLTINCVNDIFVGTITSQTGSSGNANTSGNTTGGAAASGTVFNYNGSDTTIGASCAAPAAVTPPAATPPAGGMGGGSVTPQTVASVPTAPKPVVVASLPNTGANSLTKVAAIAVAALAGVALATRLAVLGYRSSVR